MGGTRLVFELSDDLVGGPRVVDAGVEGTGTEALPGELRRRAPAAIPAVPEAVMARHVGRLARRNHNLHQGIYPLGSCTMKYNPVVDEQLAGLDGFGSLHPYQDEADTQGTLN